jgi:hypothetical protein
MRKRSTILAALALASLSAACSAPKPEPEIASSAPLGVYAKSYPAELQATLKSFSDRRAEVRKIIGEYPTYPGKLKDPDWGHVLETLERADEDGRGWAYVERSRRVEAVAAFYDAEKDELNRKVAGNVIFMAKKKSCDQEVAQGVGPALKEAFEKQAEKELADASQAQKLVDRYRAELGKENAAALEKQAFDVSRASYLARVEIVEDKLKLQRMVVEAEEIKRTADASIEAEKAFQSGKKVTDADKKASQARIDEMQKSKASIDAAVQQANAVVPSMADEIQKLQKEHADAFEALRAKLRDKKK